MVCHGLLPLVGAVVHQRPDEALPIIDELVTTAARARARWYYAAGLRLKAHAFSRAGKLEQASATYADALDLNGVGDFGELLWYTVLNILEHLTRIEQYELAALASSAIRRAPAAPSDDQVERSLARLHSRLASQLGSDQVAAFEAQVATMPLAEFLAKLNHGLRGHAATATATT